MNNLGFVLSFLIRVLRRERFRKATPEELRTDGTFFGFGGLVLLLLLVIDPDVWTAPPIVLWTGVVLSLFPLATFFWWIDENIPPVWSMVVGLSIPAIVLTFHFLQPQESVLAARAAQGGFVLYVVLMVLGARMKKAG